MSLRANAHVHMEGSPRGSPGATEGAVVAHSDVFVLLLGSRAVLAGRRDHADLALSYVAISDVRHGAVLLVHHLYWHRVGGDSRGLLIRRGVGSFAAGLYCAPSRCLAAELGSSPFLGALLEFLPVAARCLGLEPITKRIKIWLVVAG